MSSKYSKTAERAFEMMPEAWETANLGQKRVCRLLRRLGLLP
jgi:hypothetical protein